MSRKPTRQSAWTFARQCHLDAGGDYAKAEALVRERAPREFSSIWVSIAIAIALFLIRRWLDNRVSDPGETPGENDQVIQELDDETGRNHDSIQN